MSEFGSPIAVIDEETIDWAALEVAAAVDVTSDVAIVPEAVNVADITADTSDKAGNRTIISGDGMQMAAEASPLIKGREAAPAFTYGAIGAAIVAASDTEWLAAS
jgi:hypothetical protein